MLSRYEVFLKIIEKGGLTAAADALGCTQSNITHILHSLEDEFGFRLLSRSRSGASLTPEGSSLLRYIQAAADAQREMSRKAESIKRMQGGLIRVGAFTSVSVNWLPGLIRDYRALHPEAEFSLLSGDYHDMDMLLAQGEVDMAFVTRTSVPGCRVVPLRDDRIMAVLPKNHPLAGGEKLKAASLAGENMISLPETSDDDMRYVFDREGFKPNIRFTTSDDYAIIAMVAGGLGISLMPELLLTGRGENVKILELDPPAGRRISLAISERCTDSVSVIAFAKFIKDTLGKEEKK